MDDVTRDEVTARRRRRAKFLQDLAYARALRERVAPRRARRQQARVVYRLSTYR